MLAAPTDPELTMKPILSTTVVIGALLLAGSAAAQERKGVVLVFSGVGGGIARNAVVSAVSDQVELVPQDEVTARADQLGVDLGDTDGIAQVAQAMGLDVVVTGQVTGRRRRARTAIVILDRNGEQVATARAGSPAGRAGRRRVERAASRAMREALRAIPESAPPVEEPPPDDDFLGGGGGAGMGGGGGLDDGFDEEEEEDEPGERLAVPLLEAMIGLGFRTRSATINLDPAAVTAGGARGYSAGLFPEVSVRLVLRPFAADEGALRGVFAHVEAFHSLFLSSRDEETMEEIGSSALRVFGQLGYLAGVGTMQIGGGIGFGYDAFNLDENTTMSSAQYTYLRPGLVLRVPLSDELLQLQVDAGLRVALSTGGLSPMFAASASHFGYDAAVSGFGNLADGVAYALRLGYVGYSLSFEGNAENPTVNQALEGSDGYFYLTGNVGYQFR